MKINIRHLIDFEKVGTLLEGFNKSTGFVTAILDLQGNVLSKSGWRSICTEFHRVNPETSKKCTISDTTLGGKLAAGVKYHSYKCLNGLVDVAVPIIIKGEHIANLYSGQFFFEEPDSTFFKKQAEKYGFDEGKYLAALKNVPVVSEEKVKTAMDFLLNMTQMISDITLQKLEQTELNEVIQKNERILRLYVEHSPASIAMFDNNMCYLIASRRFLLDYKLGNQDVIGRSHYEVFPEISERWMKIHQRCLAGETISASNDPFPRADGTTDWVRWEIRPWYESETQIGGIILFSEVITSQIEDREALKESENYNRMLFEQSAIGLLLTSLDGRLVDLNATFSTIIGRTVEEAKALTYWDITPEKYQNQEKQQLDLLAKTGRYGPYEKEYIHKDGHLVPVRLQGLIIERHNEKFIWSSVEDISEKKKAELDLIAAKEEIEASELIKTELVIKFNEAQQSGKIGNWDWDMVTHKVWWSDELYRIFDLDPKVFIPSVESNAIHEMPPGFAPLVEDGIYFYAPEWRERITQVFTDCAKNGVPYDEEVEIITSIGRKLWVRIIGEAVRDENGHIFKVQGAFQDISERKMAEEKNREKDLQFRKLSANVPDLIFQFTRKTDGTYCVPVASEGIRNIFGCTPEDVINDFTPISNVIYPEDAERVVAEIEHSAKYLTQFTCEFRVQIPGRPVQWILSRSTPERLHDGSITWYGFNADITERKKGEENIRQLNEVLEHRVLDRTAQLDAANKELEAFSYSVSHDLRAPLRHINGYVDLLNERFRVELPEKAHHYLDTIAAASKQMGTLIDDLLQFSRTGRQEVKQVGMDMNVIVKEVLEKIKPEIEIRNITWKIQDLPMVYCDFALMNQVWFNLLDNAVKYTRNQQTAKIIIDYKKEGNFFVFFVRDNGVGFDMKYIHKLFGVFQRLHSQTEFEGTGIGLANVQRIINKHGGRVWAEAEVGKGATFFFSLPKIGKEII